MGLWLGGLPLVVGADTVQLADGSSVTGDVVKVDDTGILFRTPNDVYTNFVWTKFSQDGLKQLAQNPKIKPFAEPFIEISPSAQTGFHEVSRLAQPPQASLPGALFSSSVGLAVLLVVYFANLYAGIEIAIYRKRPFELVLGAAAVLPVLGPIVFLCLPTHVEPSSEPVEQAEAAPETFAVPGKIPLSAPGGIHIADASWRSKSTEKPEPQTFQRGQFMFNRRFFETKFPGFFSTVRPDADRNMVLQVKTPRAYFMVQRVTRITASDVHFEVIQGGVRQEVMVPFTDIQEVLYKHKDT
jgi:hypothetical protein